MSKIFILAFVFAIIWQLTCGIGLNCNFRIAPWASLGNIYACEAISIINDIDSKETITVVNGTHLSGRTNANVQGLHITNKSLEYFPVNIAQFFPNIIGLSFPNNLISEVNNQHLFPLPNFTTLRLDNNRITSLDSNLFSGLRMQFISIVNNNIKHVGHDFILPNTLPSGGAIYFNNNPCIDRSASTPGFLRTLRTSLLENCQPSWLTNVTVETQSLVSRTVVIEQSHSEMDNKVKSLTNAVADLENKNLHLINEVTGLQQENVELTNEVTALTDVVINVQQRNVELTNEVTALTNEVTNVQESNVELNYKVAELDQNNLELTNEVTDLQYKNSQLETRIGFVDTRAGYLEERVALLESIIENKLRLKIDEVVSENVS